MNLDIWAFVRVMVALEEAPPAPPTTKLYQAWEQEWGEVDRQLAELADSDFDAYSDMMMNTQISLEMPAEGQETFVTIVRALIADMKVKKQAATDPQFQKDLKFEIDGLYAILNA